MNGSASSGNFGINRARKHLQWSGSNIFLHFSHENMTSNEIEISQKDEKCVESSQVTSAQMDNSASDGRCAFRKGRMPFT